MDFPLMIEASNLVQAILKKYDITPRGNTPREIIASYFNFKHKIIQRRVRAVEFSAGLNAKADSLKVGGVLRIIERRFKEGGDVNPFLSKGAFRPEDHDYLLNDWRIHHLHLNAAKKHPRDYFNARAPWLLFVHVTNETAFFIDIRSHSENYVFAQRDLLRIVRDNWPALDQKFRVGGEKMKVYPVMGEADIATLRKKGYMFFTQVDDYAYMPGLGSATSGFSMEASREMNEFHRQLFKIHSYAQENEKEILETLSQQSGRPVPALSLSLAFKDWVFYVCEKNTGFFVNFDLSNYNPHAKKEN